MGSFLFEGKTEGTGVGRPGASGQVKGRAGEKGGGTLSLQLPARASRRHREGGAGSMDGAPGVDLATC